MLEARRSAQSETATHLVGILKPSAATWLTLPVGVVVSDETNSNESRWSIWVGGSTKSLTEPKQGEHCNALTSTFEPEVGFEPTTFRLRGYRALVRV